MKEENGSWILYCNMTEERRKLLHPISEKLCEAYSELYNQGKIFFPLQEEHIFHIDSTVKTVNAEYFGLIRFSDLKQKAAAYFCFII